MLFLHCSEISLRITTCFQNKLLISTFFPIVIRGVSLQMRVHFSHPLMETPQRKCHSFDHSPTFVANHYDVRIPSKYKREENVFRMHPSSNEHGEIIVCVASTQLLRGSFNCYKIPLNACLGSEFQMFYFFLKKLVQFFWCHVYEKTVKNQGKGSNSIYVSKLYVHRCIVICMDIL